MKRFLLASAAVFFLCALPAGAQITTVTGTVKDTNGVPYAGASMKAQLVLAGTNVTGQPVVTNNNQAQCISANAGNAPCKIPFQGTYGPISLDPTGSFTMNLQDNTQVTPASTQWQFTVNSPGNPPPLGTGPQTCTATVTISGASQSVTTSFAACPALANGSSSAAGSGIASVVISSNCPSGSLIPPCIGVPGNSGGCFLGAITNAGQPTITFQAGFPANIQVGMEAWVTLNHAGATVAGCPGLDTSALFATATNYCGAHATSPALTVSSIVPGTSITLSGNCGSTQGGTNAWLWFGWNIFTQMQAACAGNVASVGVQDGQWVIDNLAASPAGSAACGVNGAGGSGSASLIFANIGAGFLIPPWANGVGDTGTVFHGMQLRNISLVYDWTSNTVTHGTPWYASCGLSSNVKIVGFNAGVNGASEAIYPGQGTTPNQGTCIYDGLYIATQSAGISVPGGNAGGITELRNSTITTGSTPLLNQTNAAANGHVKIIGGFFYSNGATHGDNSNGSTIDNGFNTGAAGDFYEIVDATICQGANVSAIRDTETSGEVRLVNTKVNSGCFPFSIGTNASGVNVTSGINVRASQTDIFATGTGNTLAIPSGASYFDGCANNITGGAGASIGGSVFGNCSVIGTAPATGNFALTNATFTSVAGIDQKHFTLNITASAAAAITIVYTFPTPFPSAPGSCRAQQVGGTNPVLTFTNSAGPSTTAVTFLSTAAAVNTDTLAVAVDCQ